MVNPIKDNVSGREMLSKIGEMKVESIEKKSFKKTLTNKTRCVNIFSVVAKVTANKIFEIKAISKEV